MLMGMYCRYRRNACRTTGRWRRGGEKIWKEHGALQYAECVGDDLKPITDTPPFPKMVKPKAGEVIVFSYIVFKSKRHRNQVNAKVMKDPRISAGMDAKSMPFDCKRMAYGGFSTMVM